MGWLLVRKLVVIPIVGRLMPDGLWYTEVGIVGSAAERVLRQREFCWAKICGLVIRGQFMWVKAPWGTPTCLICSRS
jgi:hypothetical protein